MIGVAVIARAGADVGACLAALEAEGVSAPLVVRAGRYGLAQARNEALAACVDEVLALVEDDVLVQPGWRRALEDAWSDPAVGAAGGPLRASFPAGRPTWLTDALLPTFALQDLGPARAVPVSEGTFHGGNLSVRTAALRGIGGFWPARGHAEGRDWFSEEHHAQRELAGMGWTARWLPDAAALRVVPADLRPRDLLRRRLRYGARDTLAGTRRPPAQAARTALTSAAGAALALPRSPRDERGPAAPAPQRHDGPDAAAEQEERTPQHPDRPGAAAEHEERAPQRHDEPGAAAKHEGRAAMRRGGPPGVAVERAARAAENAGALLGAWIAHADVQPAARATPFQHTVPAPAPGPLRRHRHRRRAGDGATTILLYHRVADLEHDPLGLAVTPEHFAAHLDVLSARGDHLTLEDAASGAPGVAITFDDGYLDNAATAFPLLQQHHLNATLFVATGHAQTGRAFWWDTVDRALRHAPADAGPLTLEDRTWPVRDAAERAAAFIQIHRWLQGRPPAVQDRATRTLTSWAALDATPPPADRPLTPAELAALAPGFTLGAHTRTHRSLGQATPQEQRDELAGSGDDLALWTGRHPAACSYPYGVPGVDVTTTTLRLAAQLGYAVGVVNAPGHDMANPLALPRRTPPDAGADAFAAWL